MDKERQERYIETFRKLIRMETVSDPDCGSSPEDFENFRRLTWEMFPNIREACEYREFDGAMVLKWKGADQSKEPVLFMNHYDVVPAKAEDWKHPPFSAELVDGKIWGRGALDDKSGFWAMLQAADEMAADGFIPSRDIWFEMNCNEETHGESAAKVADWMYDQGMRFEMVFDEGGDIVRDPIGGTKGTFAMIGVGEKSVVNLKFIARSTGGHSSVPEKNTPLARLGKFMAYVDDHQVFDVEMPPAVAEMLRILAPYSGNTGKLTGKADKLKKPLGLLMSLLGATTGAMVATTLAFTMAGGGEAVNVIPGEVWAVGDMRCSHHQGSEGSIAAITKVAKKFDIEVEVISKEPESGLVDFRGKAFNLAAEAVKATVPGVDECAPYIMTGASDSRFFGKLSDQCIRFLPYTIGVDQMESIHGVNEYVSIDTLVPAVDYYRYMYQHV